MKQNAILLLLLTILALFLPANALAVPAETGDYCPVLMQIDAENGAILRAGDSAARLYGYTKEQLMSMNFADLLAPGEEIVHLPEHLQQLKQQTASGKLHTVELLFYPSTYEGRPAYLTLVHDLTVTQRHKAEHREFMALFSVLTVSILFVLLFLLTRLHRQKKQLSLTNQELEIGAELQKTFVNANNNFVFLKDEHLNYVFANKALQHFARLTEDKMVGKGDAELFGPEFATIYAKSDAAALAQNKPVIFMDSFHGRFYRTTKFPVRMPNGQFGVGGYITDVTKEHRQSVQQEQLLRRSKLLVEIAGKSFASRQEQFDYLLRELLELSGSQYGYLFSYDGKKEEFSLECWTDGVMDSCRVQNVQEIYCLAFTGIWGEVVRQGKPVVVNDFAAPNPLKKGLPDGHVPLVRFASVPIFIDGEIVAAVGLANKPTDYEESDIQELTFVLSSIWNAVQRRESLVTLSSERNKYLQVLISIGDAVMVIDRNQRVEMLNTVACRLTGWHHKAAVGRDYREVFCLSHEQEGMTIEDPIQKVFATGQPHELGGHAILTSKTGRRYSIEDSAAPFNDDKSTFAGVVLVFRDVTEKKEQRAKIEYMGFHDSLTGLYNRHFFEEELRRMNTERNLPISIIMGDVNSLKLTNDIFGHAFGDRLLKQIAGVMQHACRADDVVARWGGDEFVILLPKTGPEEAHRIAERIKQEISAQQIRAIRGSISMGHDTKMHPDDDVFRTLGMAEERMYSAKTLERNEVLSRELDNVVNALFEGNAQESRHAANVSRLCRKLGKSMGLPEHDIQRLTSAARLHDIGKIVLGPELLQKSSAMDSSGQDEVKQHPVVGYRILNYFSDTMELAEAVLSHHENWDGSGYHKGLKGEEIPLISRIISVVESYDRILHPVYGSKISAGEALKTLQRHAGTRFDPKIVDAFAKLLRADSSEWVNDPDGADLD